VPKLASQVECVDLEESPRARQRGRENTIDAIKRTIQVAVRAIEDRKQ
jgi:hypothetical protein